MLPVREIFLHKSVKAIQPKPSDGTFIWVKTQTKNTFCHTCDGRTCGVQLRKLFWEIVLRSRVYHSSTAAVDAGSEQPGRHREREVFISVTFLVGCPIQRTAVSRRMIDKWRREIMGVGVLHRGAEPGKPEKGVGFNYNIFPNGANTSERMAYLILDRNNILSLVGLHTVKSTSYVITPKY